MVNKKEINKAFKLLGLSNERKRKKILSQGVVQPKIEHKIINYIITDSTIKQKEKPKNAELE